MKAILTYHSIDDSGSPVSVRRSDFLAHVRWLASGSVSVVDLAELVELPTSDHAVALTFDDGFENFGSVAFPALAEHELPVTLFVVSGRVGLDNRWGGQDQAGVPTLPLLGWDALGELSDAGVRIGAHTHTHPRLPRLPPGRVDDELEQCVRLLTERIGGGGAALDRFAYPYGEFSPTVRERVARRFDLACTTELRTLGPADDRSTLPRLDMVYFRGTGWLERWGSRTLRGYVAARRAARRARGALSPEGTGP